MGLTSALSVAVSGLRFNQTQTQVIAGNVANVDTPGFTRRVTHGLETRDPSGITTGVQISQIQRELDVETQRLYRSNLPGASYATHLADVTARLDRMLGAPGDPTSLDALYNTFTLSMQNLASTPEDYAMRVAALSDAQVFSQRVNDVSDGIRGIRDEQEIGIGNTVNRINELLAQIEDLNTQAIALSNSTAAGPGVLDDRDRAIDELASLIDIKVSERTDHSVAIHTTTGFMLFDVTPATLQFDSPGATNPGGIYDPDPALRGVGTVEIVSAGGGTIDMIELGAIGSGKLAAQIQARDDILVEAQRQMDTFADALALSLSNETVAGTAQTVGAADGFDLDLSRLLAGNRATIDYTVSGTANRVSFVRVEQAATLPLANGVTADPTDTVVGIDFSAGFASVVTQIQTALGGSFTVSDQGGNVLRILDDGAAATIDIQSFNATVTNTALADQGIGLPFFIDGSGNQAYTGNLDGEPQKTGFASRITVNQALLDDPNGLIVYQSTPATPSGDGTRPAALYDRLVNTDRDFPAGVGFGSEGRPFNGTVSGFLTQVVAHRAGEAEVAGRFADGQNIVINNLQVRLNETSKVNIDQELSLLIEVQNAYAANARVMQVIEEMLDALLRG